MDIKLFKEYPGDDLLCDFCGYVFIDPIVNKCSHIFCSRCLATGKSLGRTRSSKNLCPICDETLETRQPDSNIKIKLLNLRMLCVNKCNTELFLSDLPDHIQHDCKLTPVKCPNEKHGCKSRVVKGNIDEHLNNCLYRSVTCEACGFKVIYCDLFTHQKRKGCLEKKLRQDITRSVRNCHANITSHYQKMQFDVFAVRQVQRKQFKTKNCHPNSPLPTARVDIPSRASGSIYANSRPISAITTTTSVASSTAYCVCQRCSKVVRTKTNHNQACTWHVGPILEVFGGLCQGCGKPDYLKGCATGYHLLEADMDADIE